LAGINVISGVFSAIWDDSGESANSRSPSCVHAAAESLVVSRGTDGSTPSSSSKESRANRPYSRKPGDEAKQAELPDLVRKSLQGREHAVKQDAERQGAHPAEIVSAASRREIEILTDAGVGANVWVSHWTALPIAPEGAASGYDVTQ
jgi:hypothetical protein